MLVMNMSTFYDLLTVNEPHMRITRLFLFSINIFIEENPNETRNYACVDHYRYPDLVRYVKQPLFE